MKDRATPRPPLVVVMGVGGSGKTTVGTELARRLEVAYADGDSFHPAANIAKMRAGHPLDDADRAPWLRMLAGHLTRTLEAGKGAVLGCSALKRAYRDVLRVRPAVFFVHLAGDREVVRRRLRNRTHFFPVALLDSQYADLEPLQNDEWGIVADLTRPPGDIAAAALAALGRGE